MTDQLNVEGKWKFDESVANCFEDMLTRSIPQYDIMRQAVVELASHALRYNSQALDIGCSDGIMIEMLLKRFSEVNYTGIDVSEPMLEKAEERLGSTVKLFNMDVCKVFPDQLYKLITSILSLQFTPIEYRQEILQKVYDKLESNGGMFIMVEKVLGSCSLINNMMTDIYLDSKRANGYTEEQIERKKLSLEGVLVPMTNDWNIDLLRQAGFRKVDTFWRWMNFVGYVAIK